MSHRPPGDSAGNRFTVPNRGEPGVGGIDMDLVLRWLLADPLPPFFSLKGLGTAVGSAELLVSDAGRKFVAAGIVIEIGLTPFGLLSARWFGGATTWGIGGGPVS